MENLEQGLDKNISFRLYYNLTDTFRDTGFQ